MSCMGLKVDESFMQKFSLWIIETAEHFPQDLWDGFNQKEWEEFTLNTHFSGIQNPINFLMCINPPSALIFIHANCITATWSN